MRYKFLILFILSLIFKIFAVQIQPFVIPDFRLIDLYLMIQHLIEYGNIRQDILY